MKRIKLLIGVVELLFSEEKNVFITFFVFVYIVGPIFSFPPFVTDTVILDLFAFYTNSKIHKSRFYIHSV